MPQMGVEARYCEMGMTVPSRVAVMGALRPDWSLEKEIVTVWTGGCCGPPAGRAKAVEAAMRAVKAAIVNCILILVVVLKKLVKRL